MNNTSPTWSRETEVAWLAGIIEGEGAIGVHKTYKIRGGERRQYRYPQIRVRMTDEDIVQRCADITAPMGGGMYGPVAGWKPHYKSVWQWTITGAPARQVLTLVLPYLGLRRTDQAMKAVAS